MTPEEMQRVLHKLALNAYYGKRVEQMRKAEKYVEAQNDMFADLSHLSNFEGPFHLSMVWYLVQFNSVQFSRSVVSDSLRPHELQHTRPPCPSPTPRVHSDSRPSSQ